MTPEHPTSASDERFIGIEEAMEILEVTSSEIEQLVAQGALSAFNIGENLLRFRRDHVSEIKVKWRIGGELFPEGATTHVQPPPAIRSSRSEKLRDFFYFNDFYFVSAAVVIALLYLIISSQ